MKRSLSAAARYVRRWAPFWGRCALLGLSVGSVSGAVLVTVLRGAVELTPYGVVLLDGAISYLRVSRGRQALLTSLAVADAQGASAPLPMVTA